MTRKLFLLAAFAVGLSFPAASAEDEKKAKGKLGKLDKAKMFEKLDANADGKLSKDEFKVGIDKMKEMLTTKGGEKAKELADKMDPEKTFEKIDADKDGSISKAEFEKFEPLADLRKK
jgi:Ca2+-binding EF-hand superfamily protein